MSIGDLGDRTPVLFSRPASVSNSSRSTSPDMDEMYTISDTAANIKKICFVGAGYVGGPTAAITALKCPDIRITVLDRDPVRIQKWKSRHLPVHEPGLDHVVRIARDGTKFPNRRPNLFFSTDVENVIAEADMVFIAVNTPTKAKGIGAGAATDLAAFESAVVTVAQNIRSGAIIVEKSTVPCGTAQTIQEILQLYRPQESFEVLSNPEFLAEGTAVQDLLQPDRILIGSSKSSAGRRAAETLSSIYAGWVNRSKILMVNAFSSELAKLVANAMLAQRISSINSISAICDQTGADIDEIAAAIGRDTRLGHKFLQAGVGFGGSCFRKDILSLVYLAQTLHLPEVADYWTSVLTINDFQMDRFTRRVVRRLHGALAGKKITVLGFAFKQDTNDTRDSPAIHVIKAIMCERPAEIAIFDPGCSPAEISHAVRSATSEAELGGPLDPIKAYANAYEACNMSSAVLILTPWKQFKSIAQEGQPKDRAKALIPSTPSPTTEQASDPTEACEILVEEPLCPGDCSICNFEQSGKTAIAHEKLDWSLIASTMREPKWLFDGRNVVDGEVMSSLGFRTENLGKPSRSV